MGGLAIGWECALGGAAFAREYAIGGYAIAEHANDAEAQEYLKTSVVRYGKDLHAAFPVAPDPRPSASDHRMVEPPERQRAA